MAEIRVHYLDTSALIRLLVEEPGSDSLRRYCDGQSVLSVTGVCFAECLGVLKTKRVRGLLDDEEYFSACEDLVARIRDRSLFLDDASVTARELFDEAERIARAYKLDLADAYQLVALRHGPFSELPLETPPLLITADRELARAARLEGLRVWNCLNEPAP
jgi:predicted nucleic acid-binding protein